MILNQTKETLRLSFSILKICVVIYSISPASDSPFPVHIHIPWVQVKVRFIVCTVGQLLNKNNRIYIHKNDTLYVNVCTQKDMVTVQQCGEIDSRQYEY